MLRRASPWSPRCSTTTAPRSLSHRLGLATPGGQSAARHVFRGRGSSSSSTRTRPSRTPPENLCQLPLAWARVLLFYDGASSVANAKTPINEILLRLQSRCGSCVGPRGASPPTAPFSRACQGTGSTIGWISAAHAARRRCGKGPQVLRIERRTQTFRLGPKTSVILTPSGTFTLDFKGFRCKGFPSGCCFQGESISEFHRLVSCLIS